MTPNTEITVTPMDVLHIISGRLMDAYRYTSNPQNNFSSQSLLKALAQTYAYAEQLDAMIANVPKNEEQKSEAN